MMKKVIIISLFLTILALGVNAQNAIGIRLGPYNGITFKHAMGSANNLEVLLSTYSQDNSWTLTGLYEWQQTLDGDFDWFIGLGGHIGHYDYNKYYYNKDNYNGNYFGADFIIGIEYNFPSVPFNVSADWKPVFNLGGYQRYGYDGVALSIRYKF